MPIRVEEYLREDGSSPYAKWFHSLDAQAAAKVATAKVRMELGNTSSIKWFDGMGARRRLPRPQPRRVAARARGEPWH